MPSNQLQPMTENTFGKWLMDQQKAITSVLPKHMTPERVMRMALLETRRTPSLLECTPASVVGGVVQAAQVGLEIGSHLGHAWLIPFKNHGVLEAQLVIGYKGMTHLAYNSDRVATVYADVVRADDFFEFGLGTDGAIKHIPNIDEYEAKIIAAYCVVKTTVGETLFKVIGRKEIDLARARSKGANRDASPWNTDFDSMAMKTALRRLFRYMPVSVEIQKAVNLDELAESGISQHNADLIPADYSVDGAPPATQTEAAMAALAKDAPPAPLATPAASVASEHGKGRARILADVQAASAIKHVNNIEDKYRDLAESEGWADALIDSCAARVNEIRESRGQ